MNWLTKIKLSAVFKRLGPLKSALVIITTISLCLYIGYRLGNFYHYYQQQVISEQQQRLAVLYQENEANLQNINTLLVELEIERLANQKSAKMLEKIAAEHYEVKKQLAFYEKIMAPEKQAEGVVIDNLFIAATNSNNHYRYQVVMVQKNKKKRYAKGKVELLLSGSLNNQPFHLALSKLVDNAAQDLAFNFKYFQMVEGEFTLPKGFVPEKVTVIATLPKGKWQKYHRLEQSYPWRVN
jgi:uncharacterized membrane-anchored protein YhcB (DUF1043 family)